jgi:hypothetical protein
LPAQVVVPDVQRHSPCPSSQIGGAPELRQILDDVNHRLLRQILRQRAVAGAVRQIAEQYDAQSFRICSIERGFAAVAGLCHCGYLVHARSDEGDRARVTQVTAGRKSTAKQTWRPSDAAASQRWLRR